MNAHKALDAIGEPRRRQLLLLLRDRGPMAVGELAELVAVTQQAVSQHLKVLQEAELVEARREGTRHIYAVRPEGFEPVQDFVEGFWGAKLQALKGAVEP
jgi:DNA-binding transcriptional ArsR family regulator